MVPAKERNNVEPTTVSEPAATGSAAGDGSPLAAPMGTAQGTARVWLAAALASRTSVSV